MTRTIEMHTEFVGTDDETYELDFGSDVTIRLRAYGTNPGKYIGLSFDDLDRVISEYENFKKLNATLENAA